MTRDEIVAQIQLLLGFRSDQVNTITAQIAIQQAHLEREVQWLKYPWFLLTEMSTTTTVDEDNRVQKPTDWIADTEEDGLYIIDTDANESILEKKDYDVLRKTYLNADPDLPEYYATFGDYYYLFPTPDEAYTIRMHYYQRDSIMSTDSAENRWAKYAPNCLIGRVGLFLSGAGNNARRDMFSALFQESKHAIETRSFDDELTNRQLAFGENF